MKKYELTSIYNNQKSFYGRALIEESKNGDVTLVSYGTNILTVKSNGKILPLWNGYSVTTQKHINEFMLQFTGVKCNKKEWTAIQDGIINTVNELKESM